MLRLGKLHHRIKRHTKGDVLELMGASPESLKGVSAAVAMMLMQPWVAK
jgi:hypothetical protein